MNLIEAAVKERPFPQMAFMTEQTFSSFLRDRGFSVGVSGVRSFVTAGLIEKLGAEVGDYHPFQIWPISQLFRQLEIGLDAGIGHYGLDPAGLMKFAEQNLSFRLESAVDFPKNKSCLEFNQQLLPLFLWLESYFLPVVRGPRPGIVHLSSFDPYAWNSWRKDNDVQARLAEHSVTVERLTEWREKMLFNAGICDPAGDFYLLLRSMPFDQRAKFKGQLRLAYDFYELAEVIRLFLEQVSDKAVLKEWDPTGTPEAQWVERIYGSQPKFGSPSFLRPVIRHFGLDPAYRVQWLVEGETEEAFVLQYAERLGADIQEFVSIRNFGGHGELSRKLNSVDAALKAASNEQCFVTLTFDDDIRGLRSRVEGLVGGGLVNMRFVLNEPDFELENFTFEQLVSVATTWAACLSQPVALSQEVLVQEVKDRIQSKNFGFHKSFNDILHCHGEQFKLSKGTEWGKRLADHLSDERERESMRGAYSKETLSKIERQVLYILRNSQPHINYPGSVKKLALDSLEILRYTPPSEFAGS